MSLFENSNYGEGWPVYVIMGRWIYQNHIMPEGVAFSVSHLFLNGIALI